MNDRMRVKNSIKSSLKLFHKHQKTRPDVYIFTLPRTGSTLLAEILNTDRSYKTVSEPFALNHDNQEILRKYIDIDSQVERYVDVNDTTWNGILNYLSDLSGGLTWNSYYWSDLLTKNHRLKTHGSVFKIHKLTYNFDDVMHHFKGDIALYLLRHPVSHSFSRMRKGWDVYLDLYAESGKIEKVLPQKAVLKIQDIKSNGSDLECFVVSWCLENYWFFHLYNANLLPLNVIPVRYEDLILYPEKTIKAICDKTGLRFSKDMLSLLKTPSSGIVHSTQETKDQIVSGNKNYLLNRWKSDVDESTANSIKDILACFEITHYSLD